MPGFIPSPEEMKMLATMRRLQQMGYVVEDLEASKETDRLLLVPKKVPNERKDSETEETAFPGEFSVMRISG